MKHGPRCPACRVLMKLECQRDAAGVVIDESYECPQCGYSEQIERVADNITVRTPEPIEPKAWFEAMRRAADETQIDGEVKTSSVFARHSK